MKTFRLKSFHGLDYGRPFPRVKKGYRLVRIMRAWLLDLFPE
jgi:hypothetical protein